MTPVMNPDIAVCFEDISKQYGQNTVLHSTNLSVRRGEFLTLLGPSGSGKSTILNIISGSTLPTTGRVFLDGEDVTRKPPRDRGLGMVFQNYALLPHLTVFENVAFPLKIRKWPQDKIQAQVTETLMKVGLSGFANRKPREMSGGQQQRVSIARCLAYSPSIILMDEPLGALDKKLRDQLQGEIKSIHRDIGTTLIYVTHDQEEALNLSDTVCLMNLGRIEQLGTPAQLYFEPSTRFAANFVGESNIFSGAAVRQGILQTEAGMTVRFNGSPSQPGQPPEVLVRPENIRVVSCDETIEDDNVFEGVVFQLSFVGGTTRVEAMVDGQRVLAARVSERDAGLVAVGAKVKLAWSQANTMLLGSGAGA